MLPYAGDADTLFDRQYWISNHLPLVRECWGPHGLLSVARFFPADKNDTGFIAICPCVFKDEPAIIAALSAPETQRVMDDVPHFTKVQPTRSLALAFT